MLYLFVYCDVNTFQLAFVVFMDHDECKGTVRGRMITCTTSDDKENYSGVCGNMHIGI